MAGRWARPLISRVLALTARTLVGRVALIGVAVGLLAYEVWKLEQAGFSFLEGRYRQL